MAEVLVKRSDKIAFMNTGTEEVPVWTRMTKFTDMSGSKNSSEYSRRYIDEESETTDVTGYSPEVSYAFDQHVGNTVHQKIVNITDNELTGDDAVVEILVVDKKATGENNATKRKYAVIPDSEGNSTDAYTYSGTFKSKSALKTAKATISDDGKTATETV